MTHAVHHDTADVPATDEDRIDEAIVRSRTLRTGITLDLARLPGVATCAEQRDPGGHRHLVVDPGKPAAWSRARHALANDPADGPAPVQTTISRLPMRDGPCWAWHPELGVLVLDSALDGDGCARAILDAGRLHDIR